jgi:hypothetical protein
MENQEHLLQEEVTNQYKRRRQLLPWWIKVFIWIFLVFGSIVPIGLIAAVFGYNFQIALYGLETNQPLSIIGLLLCVLFLLKGAVAYGLWTEKDWAVKLGIVDAIIGIAICCFIMLVYPFIDENPRFNFNI